MNNAFANPSIWCIVDTLITFHESNTLITCTPSETNQFHSTLVRAVPNFMIAQILDLAFKNIFNLEYMWDKKYKKTWPLRSHSRIFFEAINHEKIQGHDPLKFDGDSPRDVYKTGMQRAATLERLHFYDNVTFWPSVLRTQSDGSQYDEFIVLTAINGIFIPIGGYGFIK